jgi:hypothetical protein
MGSRRRAHLAGDEDRVRLLRAAPLWALFRGAKSKRSGTGQLGELEATERVLARYSKGTQAKRAPSAKTPTMAPKAAIMQRGHAGAVALRPQNQLAASILRRPSAIRYLPWQTAKRSRKSPRHARELARTMSASSLPGTNVLAASKSATVSSTRLVSRRLPGLVVCLDMANEADRPWRPLLSAQCAVSAVHDAQLCCPSRNFVEQVIDRQSRSGAGTPKIGCVPTKFYAM